jgi:hypothetical protein
MAESEVVIRNTEALSNLGSESASGIPLPTNRAARRVAASLRAATKVIVTPDSVSRRPIACPIRPGPMMATLWIDWDFRNHSSLRQNPCSSAPRLGATWGTSYGGAYFHPNILLIAFLFTLTAPHLFDLPVVNLHSPGHSYTQIKLIEVE